MDLHLTHQYAVVAGAAQGIGRAIAAAFLSEGCRVTILDRDPSVQETAAALGPQCRAAQVDVTDFPSLQEAAAACASAQGPTQHLVYAAGAGSGQAGFPFWNVAPEAWPRVLAVNLTGAAHCALAFAPQLILREGNTILFLTSVAGQTGSQTDPPYSAAKAGLINFMQCAARDFAPYGVRSNALAPGMVRSSLNQSVWAAIQQNLPPSAHQDYDTWAQEKIARLAPLARWQEPAEFGAMAVYLASPHARNITGQTLNIDGGQVMHS